MADFTVQRIDPHVIDILDQGMASFYLVEGEEKTAVIDTGITEGEQILPLIRRYTQKPLLLLLTHAHIDHWYHMDEFDTVYMSHREFQLPRDYLLSMMAGKELHPERTFDIATDDVIDLGGTAIQVCEVPGHTPGSVVFRDTKSGILFTGDILGSGAGVWMQVPGAIPLDQYGQSLKGLLKWLADRGGCSRFCGGHRYQMFQSDLIPGYNPLSMGLLCDMIDLVDRIVSGKIVGRPSNVNRVFTLEPPLYASFGRAEIQYLPSRIHSKTAE